MEKTLI